MSYSGWVSSGGLDIQGKLFSGLDVTDVFKGSTGKKYCNVYYRIQSAALEMVETTNGVAGVQHQ